MCDDQQVAGYIGEIFYFTANPFKEKNCYVYHENGVLYVYNGKIIDVGDYNLLKHKYRNAHITDYSNKLITPGFVDTHTHYPQFEIMAAYGEELLGWLNKYTFPTERKFKDKKYSKQIAKLFLKQLINNGTTSALVFATSAKESVEAFFEEADKLNMRMVCGKVFMNRNAPEYLIKDSRKAYLQDKELISEWHNKNRLKYAATLRFAITSDNEELKLTSKLIHEYPDILFQTHLAESNEETALAKKLFPDSNSYLDIYNHYKLTTSRSIFAHSIWIKNQDYLSLAKNNANISFCPSANLFLGSGLFNFQKAIKHNINVSLGTDIGAGTSLSMLKAMAEAYKVTQLNRNTKSITPLQNQYIATLGGAKALSLNNYIGSFKSNNEADFIVIDLQATPEMAIKYANNQTIEDKLFTLQMLGDDRAIKHTYIAGKKVK